MITKNYSNCNFKTLPLTINDVKFLKTIAPGTAKLLNLLIEKKSHHKKAKGFLKIKLSKELKDLHEECIYHVEYFISKEQRLEELQHLESILVKLEESLWEI